MNLILLSFLNFFSIDLCKEIVTIYASFADSNFLEYVFVSYIKQRDPLSESFYFYT